MSGIHRLFEALTSVTNQDYNKPERQVLTLLLIWAKARVYSFCAQDIYSAMLESFPETCAEDIEHAIAQLREGGIILGQDINDLTSQATELSVIQGLLDDRRRIWPVRP